LNQMELFLRTRGSENTRRAYERALVSLARTDGILVQEGMIGSKVVANWVADMESAGLADTTINQRLAAVSSYCRFLEDMGISAQAPRLRQLRRQVNPYGKSGYLRVEQVRALLGVIERETIQGSRDYALLLMFLATGRRSTEIRTLKWGDFSVDAGKCFYRWRGKGKKGGVRECPWEVWEAIIEWLTRSGRLVHLDEGDYIFTAIRGNARRLPKVLDTWEPGTTALAMQTVSQILRRYARKAGIQGRVHVHMLRHSAAMLRKSVGEDVLSIQEFLGHSTAAVTQVYLHQLEVVQDVGWSKVRDILGIQRGGRGGQ
jgi:site-specific recombinase XerD